MGGLGALAAHLGKAALSRAAQLKQAHDRVREAAKARVRTLRVEPQPPVDVLGIYVFLPVARS